MGWAFEKGWRQKKEAAVQEPLAGPRSSAVSRRNRFKLSKIADTQAVSESLTLERQL